MPKALDVTNGRGQTEESISTPPLLQVRSAGPISRGRLQRVGSATSRLQQAVPCDENRRRAA